VTALLKEVTVRSLHGRGAEDNVGSIRVLECNGFLLVGSEDSFAAGRQATLELMCTLPD
jgi:ribosomal-protein-alanine N-acetyltransferase